MTRNKLSYLVVSWPHYHSTIRPLGHYLGFLAGSESSLLVTQLWLTFKCILTTMRSSFSPLVNAGIGVRVYPHNRRIKFLSSITVELVFKYSYPPLTSWDQAPLPKWVWINVRYFGILIISQPQGIELLSWEGLDRCSDTLVFLSSPNFAGSRSSSRVSLDQCSNTLIFLSSPISWDRAPLLEWVWIYVLTLWYSYCWNRLGTLYMFARIIIMRNRNKINNYN